MPSEPELAGLYNVSRDTVRKAMAVLRELEVVETRRGAGHYVAHLPEVLVVEEPGQPPRVYDGTRTLVSFVDLPCC